MEKTELSVLGDVGFLNMNPNITSFIYFPKIGLFIVEVEDKKRKQQTINRSFL